MKTTIRFTCWKRWGRRAAAVAVAGLTCCDSPQPPAEAVAPTEPGRLRLHSWSEYFDPQVLEDFERETGCQVVYEVFEDGEEVEARLRSEPETVDVAVIDSFTLGKWRKLSLLKRLDKSLLPNMRHISPRYLGQKFNEGNAFSVPYMLGTTVVAYRRDKVQPSEPSWSLLWDESLKGRVMMIEDRYDPVATALLLQGHSPASEVGAEYQAAAQALIDQLQRVEARYGSDADVREGLLSGEVWAAMCYNGDAAMIAEEDGQIDYFIPKEGAPEWVDNLVISRDSRNPKLSHAFLDFMMRPEVAARNSNYTRYANPNKDSLPHLDPELVQNPRVFMPPEAQARCVPVPPLTARLERLVHSAWHAVQSARAGHPVELVLDAEGP